VQKDGGSPAQGILELEAELEKARREEVSAREMAAALRRLGAPPNDVAYAQRRALLAELKIRRLQYLLDRRSQSR
jgi:hypothetical protein